MSTTTEPGSEEEIAETKVRQRQLEAKDPVRDKAKTSFLSEHMGKRFWMLVSAILFVLLLVQPAVLIPMLRKDQLVIAVDGTNTFHIGPGVEFLKSEDMMTSNALTATYALLMKSPIGFEMPEILNQILTTSAVQRAKEELDKELPDLKERRMSVKPNVAKIEVVSVDEGQQTRLLMRVTGQLRYSGQTAGQLFEYYNDFTLLLRMVKNPKLTLNQRFPLVVYDWELRTTPGVKTTNPSDLPGIKQDALELLQKSEEEKRSPNFDPAKK